MEHFKENKDLFFKLLMQGDDEDSEYLKKIIMEEGLGLKYERNVVKTTEAIPERNLGKKMFYDTLLEDEKKRCLHFEMQRSSLHKEFLARVFSYGCRVLNDYIKQGEKYDNGYVVHQAIFIDDDVKHSQLKQTYTHRLEDGAPYGVQKLYTTFFFISYIDEVLKHKSIDQLTSFECIIYFFKFGLGSDIMKLQRKVVDIMKEKVDAYIQDYGKILEERSINDYKWYVKGIEETNKHQAEEIVEKNQKIETLQRTHFDQQVTSVRAMLEVTKHSIEEIMDKLKIPEENREEIKGLIENMN